MYQLFDASFFRVKGTVQELAPLVAKHGMGGINVPVEILEDVNLAREAAKCVYDNGLQWGLLPTPVDCLSGFATDDKMFDEGMEKLKRWAEIGKKLVSNVLITTLFLVVILCLLTKTTSGM